MTKDEYIYRLRGLLNKHMEKHPIERGDGLWDELVVLYNIDFRVLPDEEE